MLRELRLTIRALLRQPGFTTMAIVILALGLGATTAMFSLVNTLLLQPLPYPDPDRLVRIERTTTQERGLLTSPPTFRDYRAQSSGFSGMAALITPNFTLADAGGPAERIQGGEVSEDFFALLGARPLLGRLFLAEESQDGHDNVVVLSASAWQRLFNRDPEVVGRKFRLAGRTVTVVGVLPASFNPPLGIWGAVEVWRPMSIGPGSLNNRHGNWLQIVARLKPGVTLAQAQAQLDDIAMAIDRAHGTRSGVAVTRLRSSPMGTTEARVAWFTLGLAVLVLMIACTNLAGVQLARLASRGHEHAIHLALGASRGRLLRQSLLEGLLLCLAGGALGLLLAVWSTSLMGARLVVGVLSAAHPSAVVAVPMDARVLGFGLVLALLTALAVGTVPAWLTTRGMVANGLRTGGRGATDRAQPRLRRALVVAQMSLALMLLAAGGLLLRGLERFAVRDLGWKADGLLSGFVTVQGAGYRTPADRVALYQRLQQRLERVPGVQSVALSGSIPRGGLGAGALETVTVEGAPPRRPAAAAGAGAADRAQRRRPRVLRHAGDSPAGRPLLHRGRWPWRHPRRRRQRHHGPAAVAGAEPAGTADSNRRRRRAGSTHSGGRGV
jgi:putative ABC transport system permease protein